MRFFHSFLFFFLIMFVALGAEVRAQVTPSANDSAKVEVERVLRTQQEAWNRHDLEGFMAGYWNSPELTFFSGAKESMGWQAALDRYKKNYQGAGHDMGRLEFANLRIEMVGALARFGRG